MKFMPMRELRNNTSKLLDKLTKEGIIITRNGKPSAVMMRIDEDTLEEFIVKNYLAAELDAALQEYKEKGGTSLEEVRKRIENG